MSTTITGSLDYRSAAPPTYGQQVQFSPVAGSNSRIITALGTGYCGDTDPGVNNVISGHNYWAGGASKTATYALPNNAAVSSRVTYGVSGGTTGGLASSKIMDATYGTLATSSVLSSAGGTLSTSVVLTGYGGTLVLPAAAKVYSGTQYGVGGSGSTGTLHASNIHSGAGAPGVDLTAAALQSGVTVDNVAGTYDPVTGNYTDPGKDNVLTGHNYTFGGVTQTAALTLPTASQTLAGVSFGVAGNGITGTVTLPPEGKVQNDTSYGAGGSQFTGTIDLSNCVPSNIKNNVIIAGVTGTLEPIATGMLTLYA